MHALIVVAHPDPDSLSHGIAASIADGVSAAHPGHTSEIVDLVAEGFNPTFGAADRAVHREKAPPPADVAAEQARIDRADALVLVYPVYWWSMPAVLKGWIDRVFSNGWAFDFSPDAPLVKKLRGRQVHLVAIAGSDARTFEKHGYRSAMKTQIDHGIFDYCGASVATSELMFDSETEDATVHLEKAKAIGRDLFTRGAASAAKAA
jgi:NAD(P)H dehydrogenase (quinone)